MKPLIGHVFAEQGEPAPVGQLYDFIMAANGVFVRAARAEFEVCNLIGRCEVRGLSRLDERFDFNLPRVPEDLVAAMLEEAAEEGRRGLEVLFHLLFEAGEWALWTPTQEQSHARCKATEDGDGSTHQRAVIEVHSHHSMPARFSGTDDADETGFRLYAVVGNLFERPEITLRVGVYGYMKEMPARRVFEMPAGLRDCGDWRC
jgi:PRTRC genetic system protein A